MDDQARKPIGMGRPAVMRTVLRMLEVCGVCSTDHVAQLYAHATRPRHRAWTVLEDLRGRGYVESWRPVLQKAAVHRLTRAVRQRYDLPLVRWNARIWHRVAVTDAYVALDMPDDFVNEPRATYTLNGESYTLAPDAFTQGMLIEVQRSPMKAKQWADKRRHYEQFFRSGVWTQFFETRPSVVVVQSHDQQSDTIGAGVGYQLHVVRNIKEVYDLGILHDDREVHRQSAGQADRR